MWRRTATPRALKHVRRLTDNHFMKVSYGMSRLISPQKMSPTLPGKGGPPTVLRTGLNRFHE